MIRDVHNEKIGNILAYLADEERGLSMTKALKLLFFIDMTSIQERGVPVTGLTYKAWKQGPVAVEVWNELGAKKIAMNPNTGEYISFEGFIAVEETSYGKMIRPANRKHSFDEFAKKEVSIIRNIVAKYGHLTSGQLSDHTHKEGTPWAKVVDKYNLKEVHKTNPSPNVDIDLSEILNGDNPAMIEAYESFQDALVIKRGLHSYQS
jgi:uncharacterized phage-associated protein